MSQTFKHLFFMRDKILEFLEKEKSMNEDALQAYDPQIIPETDNEIRIMREREAIKLRDRIYELKRYIEVIKRMFPSE